MILLYSVSQFIIVILLYSLYSNTIEAFTQGPACILTILQRIGPTFSKAYFVLFFII